MKKFSPSLLFCPHGTSLLSTWCRLCLWNGNPLHIWDVPCHKKTYWQNTFQQIYLHYNLARWAAFWGFWPFWFWFVVLVRVFGGGGCFHCGFCLFVWGFTIVAGIQRKILTFSRITYFWMLCRKHENLIYLKENISNKQLSRLHNNSLIRSQVLKLGSLKHILLG